MTKDLACQKGGGACSSNDTHIDKNGDIEGDLQLRMNCADWRRDYGLRSRTTFIFSKYPGENPTLNFLSYSRPLNNSLRNYELPLSIATPEERIVLKEVGKQTRRGSTWDGNIARQLELFKLPKRKEP